MFDVLLMMTPLSPAPQHRGSRGCVIGRIHLRCAKGVSTLPPLAGAALGIRAAQPFATITTRWHLDCL